MVRNGVAYVDHSRRAAVRSTSIASIAARADELASLLDGLPIAAFVARPDERFTYVSVAWLELMRLDRVTATAGTVLECVRSSEIGAAREAWAAAVAARLPFRFEARMVVGDGSLRWIAIEAHPLSGGDATDEFTWFGTFADIDDRRHAEERLRESAERYRAFSEALPGMTWSATPDGRIEFVGARFTEVRGMPPESVLGEGWLESLHPSDRAATRRLWAASLATGEPYQNSFRIRMADGTYRWHLARARPRRTSAGEIAQWIGVNIDIEEERRADDARELFVALAENSGDFIATADLDGNVVYVNDAGRRLLGLDGGEARGKLVDFFSDDDVHRIESSALPGVVADGRWLGDAHFRNARTGARVPVTCNIFRLTDRRGAPLGVATISHDRRGRERVEGGLRMLARTAGAALDSLDYVSTLRNIARSVVAEFASYCLIDALDEQHRWERTSAHRDPALEVVLQSLSEPPPDHPIARAIERGVSFVGDVDDSWARSFGEGSDRVAAVRALRVRSFITVPIVTPLGAIVGALTCALDADAHRENYTRDDLAFVEEVGRRAGSAFSNARLYERERRIAVELQAASLPTTLPGYADLELDAEYRPGSAEATIGGDWYDAFELADGRIAVTVGDVLGHGLHAAVTMTKLRQSMQAAAMLRPDPGAMLTVADKTLRAIDSEGYATALAAIYDRVAGTLCYDSAGHPGPVVRGPGGDVVDLTRSGLMLGLQDGREREATVVPIAPGSTIVFFTDGLIEATRDIAEGERRLHAYLASEAAAAPGGAARRIVEHVLDGHDASDDIAVLVAKIGVAAGPGTKASV